MDLREYEQDKFTVAEILRSVGEIVPRDVDAWSNRIRTLFARLAEDRFNLVVVGRFSRGKSTLMNAIMGADRLPTGIVPLTSVITTVSYGTRDQVVLRYDERILTQQVPIVDLPKYVTQQGNPGNVKRIKMAEVQLRAEILRRGFYFVDTPGLGSAIKENTRTTESFLPEADAFLVVTSHESPMSDEELRFFRLAAPSARRIFVAVNKHDLVSSDEREQALAYVCEQLRQVFVRDAPQVFSVSARDGLAAKQSQDPDRLAASGLPALEEALVAFLLAEKSTHFLLSMCERVADLVHDLPATDEAAALLDRIGETKERLSHATGAALPAITSRSGLPTLHQLRDCEICKSINEALWNFLCKYQYELIVNRAEQREFAARGGFCSVHTWQYDSVATPYGMCNGFPTLFDRLASLFQKAATGEPGAMAEAMDAITPSADRCVLCNVRERAEADAVARLAGAFAHDGARALASLSALCLRHFRLLSGALTDAETVRNLMQHQATMFERIAEDMRRHALKHDATRRHLESREEETAGDRALLLLAGHRNVHPA